MARPIGGSSNRLFETFVEWSATLEENREGNETSPTQGPECRWIGTKRGHVRDAGEKPESDIETKLYVSVCGGVLTDHPSDNAAINEQKPRSNNGGTYNFFDLMGSPRKTFPKTNAVTGISRVTSMTLLAPARTRILKNTT